MPNVNWNEYVIDLLKSHNSRMRMIGVLRYELQNPEKVTSQDMTEALSYSRDDSAVRSEEYISDRTRYIALCSKNSDCSLRDNNISEIAAQLWKLEEKERKLLYYINLLNERERMAVELLYFKGYTQQKAADEMIVSIRSIQRIKEQAIEELASFYRLAAAHH